MTTAKQLTRRMSAQDAGFLYFERPEAPLHVGSIAIFEGSLPLEKIRQNVAERMHLIPRYRQGVHFPPLMAGHPTWEDYPEFSVDEHIVEVALPAPGTERQLLEVCAALYEEPMRRDRPLWDITVVTGLEGDRSAFVSRVHHCMIDGASGIELTLILLDLVPEPPPTPPPAVPWNPQQPPDPLVQWADALSEQWSTGLRALSEGVLRPPRDTLRDAGDLIRAMQAAVPATLRLPSPLRWNRRIGKRRAFSVTSMAFQEVRGIRSALGCTVNDVVLTLIAGALGRYLDAHGEKTAGTGVRFMIPVNVRGEEEEASLGNRVSMMLPELPAGIADPVERLLAVGGEMNRVKSADQGSAFDRFMQMAGNAPAALHMLAGMGGLPAGTVNVVCTNVPGPLVPLYSAGHRMLAYYPLLPLFADAGIGVAVMSYDKSLYVCVTSEPDIVPDADRICAFLDEEFFALRTAAGVPQSDLPEIGVLPPPAEPTVVAVPPELQRTPAGAPVG